MMNLKMKALAAAAVAAMAMSGAANAAVNLGNTGVGSSDLIFSAWDATDQTGYTFDLNFAALLNGLVGLDTSTANGGSQPAPTYGVASGPANGVFYSGALTGFNSFLAKTDSTANTQTTLANVVWNLAAADSAAGSRQRFLTTSNDAIAPTNLDVSSAASGFTGITGLTGQGSYAVYDSAGGSQNIGVTWGALDNATPLAMGDSAGLQLAAQMSTLSGGNNTASFLGNVMYQGQQVSVSTFQDGNGLWNVQIAAVPEADTYAMFLAGLGLMGFIARRRMQA